MPRPAPPAQKRDKATEVRLAYRVIGHRPVDGVQPGKILRCSTDRARSLLAAGLIEPDTADHKADRKDVRRNKTADETGHDSPDEKE